MYKSLQIVLKYRTGINVLSNIPPLPAYVCVLVLLTQM